MIDNGMFRQWEQWAKALSMVPGSEFYQRLYDGLPSSFQTTLQQNLEAICKAEQEEVVRMTAEAQKKEVPKRKSS